MSISTLQRGQGLLSKGAPKFLNYVVVDKSWKPKGNGEIMRTDDGDGNVYNYSKWRPGVVAKCDLTIKKNSGVEIEGLDVLLEMLELVFLELPAAATLVGIGGETYKFVAALSVGPAVAYEVLIGATIGASIANLTGAINAADAGGQAAGTTYGAGTVINPNVTAVASPNSSRVNVVAQEPESVTNATVTGELLVWVGGIVSGDVTIARPFIVSAEPDTSDFGGPPLKQAVELSYHEGFVPSLVS